MIYSPFQILTEKKWKTCILHFGLKKWRLTLFCKCNHWMSIYWLNLLFWCSQGLFLIPELTSQVGFDLLRNSVEHEVDHLVVEALSPNRKRKIVTIFDEMSNTLCCVADMVRFCFSLSHLHNLEHDERHNIQKSYCILSHVIRYLHRGGNIHVCSYVTLPFLSKSWLLYFSNHWFHRHEIQRHTYLQ